MRFYAFGFFDSGYGKVVARSLRVPGYKTETAAKKAVIRHGDGYVKKLGQNTPIWNNLHAL